MPLIRVFGEVKGNTCILISNAVGYMMHNHYIDFESSPVRQPLTKELLKFSQNKLIRLKH